MPLPLGLHSMTICAILHCRIWAYNESEKINFFSPYLTPAYEIWKGADEELSLRIKEGAPS